MAPQRHDAVSIRTEALEGGRAPRTYLFEDLLFAFVVPARADHEVEMPLVAVPGVLLLLCLGRAESRVDVTLVSEAPPEKPPNALHVPEGSPSMRSVEIYW